MILQKPLPRNSFSFLDNLIVGISSFFKLFNIVINIAKSFPLFYPSFFSLSYLIILLFFRVWGNADNFSMFI